MLYLTASPLFERSYTGGRVIRGCFEKKGGGTVSIDCGLSIIFCVYCGRVNKYLCVVYELTYGAHTSIQEDLGQYYFLLELSAVCCIGYLLRCRYLPGGLFHARYQDKRKR